MHTLVPKIVVVGSSNMDLISYVPRMPKPGETIAGTKFRTGYGGKGANQAVMAALLGGDVEFVGKVGVDAFGTEMRDNFKKLGIKTGHLLVTDLASSGVAPITVSDDGENSIIVVLGANLLLREEEVRNARNTISAAQVLLTQLEITLETTMEALKIGKENSVTTILNTAPAKSALPLEIYKTIDILCANETELEILTSLTVKNKEESVKAARVILDRGVGQVIVTMGGDGSMLVTEDNVTHVPSSKVKVTDTTGAGDCFIGSFAYFLALGSLPIKAMEKASFCAGISVTRLGTQTSYPRKSEIPDSFFVSH